MLQISQEIHQKYNLLLNNQVNALNVKNIDTFDKAKANTKNQISHSRFSDDSNASHDSSGLNISVNENTATYKKSLPDKAQHLRSVQNINSKIHTLTPSDVKAFLEYLAVKRNVAASTQNQAFNALLFFYNTLLKGILETRKTISGQKGKSIYLLFYHGKRLT